MASIDQIIQEEIEDELERAIKEYDDAVEIMNDTREYIKILNNALKCSHDWEDVDDDGFVIERCKRCKYERYL